MPPSYNVAAVQMARYHRMNRAHSHEGVVTPPFNPGPVKPPYYHTNETEEDEGEWSGVEDGGRIKFKI